ncbi:hypothetical protein HK414_27240 [Ramlibacter terrae]|uniref:Outer membrane protein assembly factor BamE n=1 Tax=Ramlibacter terrae TaxID=2732511 RepID=A0ABX6P624_9BURK|nr:hypothetical protein HK414_27240 [Ramlibacter terrae]
MRPIALVFTAVLLAACAHPRNTLDLPVGASREQVIARAGQPTRVLPLPGGGQRLQYSGQPMAQYAFMVDPDATGRVVRARQVLTAAEFARIEPGTGPAPTSSASSGRPRAWTASAAGTAR